MNWKVCWLFFIGAAASAVAQNFTNNLTASHLNFYEEMPSFHLTEGTHQRWIYNLDLETCAQRCTFSAREEPERITCRSFEFYPFEQVRPDPPWYETANKGICVLNSETHDNARLRYEDEGYTDAELVYTSHFTKRFVSSHYHAVDFGKEWNPVIYKSMGPNRIPWSFSRQGAVVVSEPEIQKRRFMCVPGGVDNSSRPVQDAVIYANTTTKGYYTRALFVPLDYRTGHCPTMVTRTEASAICTQAGATFCKQRELRMTFNDFLGCDIDGEDGTFPVWGLEDVLQYNQVELKYVKCCSDHRYAMTCDSYTRENINFCRDFKTESECVKQGSGFQKQETLGFGKLLYEIRRDCLRNENSCGNTASNYWAPRDRCIWCGNECRPGSDYGVCGTQTDLTERFAKLFSLECSSQAACDLANAYPNLWKSLVEPFERPQGNDAPATPHPTKPNRCQDYKTPQECYKYFDDCFWGVWYGTPVCRPIEKYNTPRPTPKKKNVKKKGL